MEYSQVVTTNNKCLVTLTLCSPLSSKLKMMFSFNIYFIKKINSFFVSLKPKIEPSILYSD